MSSRCYLFAYGTLKPGERAFANLCQPFAIATQLAQVPGRLYHLPVGYPAMTLEPGWVQGILITFADQISLPAIDAFEEYYPDRPEASEYQRHPHLIYDVNHQPLVSGWVYTMDCARVIALHGQWLPQGYWTERPPNQAPR